MNWLDAIIAARVLQREIEDQAEGMELKESLQVDIPDARKVGALLIRGEGGKRFRIKAVVVEREK